MELPVARLTLHDITVAAVLGGASVSEMQPDARRRLYDAAREGLRTDVALVWPDADGRTKCLAPPQQKRFFESLRYDQLLAQASGTLVVTSEAGLT